MQGNIDIEHNKNILSKNQTPKKPKQKSILSNTPIKVPKSINKLQHNFNSKILVGQQQIRHENFIHSDITDFNKIDSNSSTNLQKTNIKSQNMNRKNNMEFHMTSEYNNFSKENGIKSNSLADPFSLAPNSTENKMKDDGNDLAHELGIKRKKDWKSWSSDEKVLFYEAIANGENFTSLQKLFKTMNDVKFYNNFIENRNKKH